MTMLLLPEKPISVLPTLATKIGLNEAIAIQQLHYWLLKSKGGTEYGEKRDGRVWVYNNYEHWREQSFPFWSVSTIRRIFTSLERQELVLTRMENNPKLAGGKRKWYTIDYGAVEELGKQAGVVSEGMFNLDTPSGQDEHTPLSKLDTPSAQNEQAIYIESETTAENTSETTQREKQQQQLSSTNESEYQDLVKEAAASAGSEDPCPPDCDRPNAFALFENNIALLTPILSDDLGALLDEFPESWVENAIKEGARNGAKTVKYIKRVLERWRKDGPPSELAPALKVYEGRGSSVPPPGWKPGEFLYVVPDIPLEEEWDRGS